MGKWGTGKVLKKCIQCEKEFLARQDRLGKFCSRSCGSKNKPKRYLRIKKKCMVCLKEFEVKRYRIYSALYCSYECRRKMMPKKENHVNWKGGKGRTWNSKSLIKKLIMIKGKCDLCGCVDNLQGHHVIPYSKDKDLQECKDNIRVLCIKCHSNQHPGMEAFILKGKYHE